MLPERFELFQKSCIYKEKCRTITKRKRNILKNVIINQITLEHFAGIYYTTALLNFSIAI